MAKHRIAATRATRRPVPATFDPAGAAHRRDGWTPARQVGFVEALAECGCVHEACQRVGMGTSSAYALRRRLDAAGFRAAWDAALDVAVERLSDAVFARAIKGVATPIFYKGEQVGERVRHDEKLAMFLLRYRDPVRYGAWTDRWRAERAPDGAAIALAAATDAIGADGPGRRAPCDAPVAVERRYVAVHERDVVEARHAANHVPGYERATREETDAALLKLLDARSPARDFDDDGSCGSSTSAPADRSDRAAGSAIAAEWEAPP